MKKSIILSAFLFLFNFGYAQTPQKFQWGVKAGGAGADKIAGITSVENYLYVAGQYSGKYTSGAESTPAGNGIFLSRLDKNGKTDWVRSITGDIRNSVTRISPSGKDVLIGGLITGAVNVENNLLDGKGQSLFLSLWSDKGKNVWLNRISYTGHATLDVLMPSPDGNLIMGGMFQGTIKPGESEWQSPFERRAYFMTLSPAGKPLKMMVSTGKGSHRLVSATTAGDGNLYLLFSITGDFALGKGAPVVTPTDMNNGLAMVKISPAGEVVWQKTIPGTGYLEGFKILSLKTGDVLVCANYTQTLRIGKNILFSKGGVELILLLFTDKGDYKKAERMVSPVAVRGMDAMLVNRENILVTGYFRQEFSTAKERVKSLSSLGDLFLLQMNSSLETVWHDEPAQEAASYSKSFTLDETGNIILAGAFKGQLNLKGKKMSSEDKEDDVFIAKYCNCLLKEATIAGNPVLCTGGTTELSVKGNYQAYSWNGQEGKSSLTVTKPGFYTVLAYDRTGCAAADTVEVKTMAEMDLGLPEEATLSPAQPVFLMPTPGFDSYQWSDGKSFPAREISFETENGAEQLILTAFSRNGCLATDTVKLKFVANTETGISPENQIQIWPNPVGSILSWSANLEDAERLTVSLSDEKGVIVYRREMKNYPAGSVQSLDMSKLAVGNYILLLKTGNRSFNRKIVKK